MFMKENAVSHLAFFILLFGSNFKMLTHFKLSFPNIHLNERSFFYIII